MNVGHELLQSIKRTDELLKEMGMNVRFGYIRVEKGAFRGKKAEVDVIVNRLLDMGMILGKTELTSNYTKRELLVEGTTWSLEIDHKPTDEEKILALKIGLERKQKELELAEAALKK